MNFRFRRLMQACRDRHRAITARSALVDRLGRSQGDFSQGSDGHGELENSAWEELFDRPEWRRESVSHSGRCSRCESVVSLDRASCGVCGAVWKKNTDFKKRVYSFCFVSVVAALALGASCSLLFLWIAKIYYNSFSILSNYEFVDFVKSYLFVFCAFLTLLLSTYVFEKFAVAPKGNWVSQPLLPESQIPVLTMAEPLASSLLGSSSSFHDASAKALHAAVSKRGKKAKLSYQKVSTEDGASSRF